MPVFRWPGCPGRDSNVDGADALVGVAAVFDDVQTDGADVDYLVCFVFEFDEGDVGEGLV